MKIRATIDLYKLDKGFNKFGENLLNGNGVDKCGVDKCGVYCMHNGIKSYLVEFTNVVMLQ